ncbi:ribonuclease III [bacterium NHP-B]|nr:ribonuclease III [bacterium NHP-B]
MVHKGSPDVQACEQHMGYVFENKKLLQDALLHKSVSPQPHVSAFERLEFLGDRVLNLVISEKLYRLFPHSPESHLAVHLSQLINRDTLYQVATNLNLAAYLRFDKTNPLQRKVLSDGLEALIGAFFLDAGLTPCTAFIHKHWQPFVSATTARPQQDSKSMLQDWTQKHYGILPTYAVTSKTGPAHSPCIEVELTIAAEHETWPSMHASGYSKREAEKQAAKDMLAYLEKHGVYKP